MKRFWKNR